MSFAVGDLVTPNEQWLNGVGDFRNACCKTLFEIVSDVDIWYTVYCHVSDYDRWNNSFLMFSENNLRKL